MLACRERGGDEAVSRFDAAHDLDHGLDLGVVHDLVDGRDLKGLVRLAGPNQDGDELQIRGLPDHLTDADADRPVSQNRYFHVFLSPNSL